MRARLINHGPTTWQSNYGGSVRATSQIKKFLIPLSCFDMYKDAYYSGVTGDVNSFIKGIIAKFSALQKGMTYPITTEFNSHGVKVSSGGGLTARSGNVYNDNIMALLKEDKDDSYLTIYKYHLEAFFLTGNNGGNGQSIVDGESIFGTRPSSYSKTFYVTYDKINKLIKSVSTVEPTTTPYYVIDLNLVFEGGDPEITFSNAQYSGLTYVTLNSDTTKNMGFGCLASAMDLDNRKYIGIYPTDSADSLGNFNFYANNTEVPSSFLSPELDFKASCNITLVTQDADLIEVYAKI